MPQMMVMGLRGGPMQSISKPGGCGIERKSSKPDSGGQCLYRKSTTVAATESLMPETNTFGRGSTNQSFMRPRTAAGKSFATTTSMAPPQHRWDVIGKFCQQIHLDDALPECGANLCFIVTPRQLPSEGKG